MSLPATLAELRTHKTLGAQLSPRSVKDESRANLICKLQKREPLFPGIVGFDDTVVPQVINAVSFEAQFYFAWAARAGQDQADSDVWCRYLTSVPYVAGCEIRGRSSFGSNMQSGAARRFKRWGTRRRLRGLIAINVT